MLETIRLQTTILIQMSPTKFALTSARINWHLSENAYAIKKFSIRITIVYTHSHGPSYRTRIIMSSSVELRRCSALFWCGMHVIIASAISATHASVIFSAGAATVTAAASGEQARAHNLRW